MGIGMEFVSSRKPGGSRRRRVPGLRGAPALAAAAILAACTTHPAPPISAQALRSARSFKEYTVYWAGPSVDGTPLTAANSPLYFYAPVGFAMYYGDCEGRGTFHAGGCTFPLRITTSIYSAAQDPSSRPLRRLLVHGVPAVAYNQGRNIEVYTDRMGVNIVADTPARAIDAARALRLFNRRASAGFPAFPEPVFQPRPAQAPEPPRSGPTGVTGATSDIGPPSTLEPASATRRR